MIMSHNNTLPNANSSEGENVSEIQSLTAQAERLSQSVDSWNTWIIVLMVVAAVAATGLVVATYKAFRTARILAKIETKRVELFGERASIADQRAVEANKKISEANARTAEAELKLAEFRQPRGVTPEQTIFIIEKIRPFAGTMFDVGHSDLDREQWDFLWQFEPVLPKAGWVHIDWIGGQMFKKNNWPGDHRYGRMAVINVSIEVHPESREKLLPAAKALAEALNGIGIAATVAYFNNSSMNANAVHLLVGPKR